MMENIKFKVNGERYGILGLQNLGLSLKLIHEDLMTSYQCIIFIFLPWLGFLTLSLRLMWHSWFNDSWSQTDSDTNSNTETPWHSTSTTYHNQESVSVTMSNRDANLLCIDQQQQQGNSQDDIWQQCLFLDTPTAFFQPYSLHPRESARCKSNHHSSLSLKHIRPKGVDWQRLMM